MRRALLVACGAGALALSASAAEVGPPTLFDASRAIEEGIPVVAIEKLRECLASNPAPEQRAGLVAKLAEAQLVASQPEAALETLRAHPVQSDEALLAKAEALSSLGRWAEARPLFSELDRDGSPLRLPARLGEAEALRMLSRGAEAIPLLESLVEDPGIGTNARLLLAGVYAEEKDADKCQALLDRTVTTSLADAKWKSYIQGMLFLARGASPAASAVLEQIIKEPRGLPENLLVSATVGAADARATLRGPEAGDDLVEFYIWHYPDSPYLELMFRKLDAYYTEEKSPSLSELKAWMIDPEHPRRAALARFFLAKLRFHLKEYEEAARLAELFIQGSPEPRLQLEALLLKARVLLAERKAAACLPALEAAARITNDPATLGQVRFLAGSAYFEQRQFAMAAEAYREAGGLSAALREEALFDSALSWGNMGAYDKFLAVYKEFRVRFPASDLLRELALEEGLLQARTGDPRAAATLGGFIRDFPANPRIGEARVALAELAFLASPPRQGEASHYLKAAFESPAEPRTNERAEYLAIFMADAGHTRDEAKVIKECEDFIEERPASPLLAEVRMELGQIYFRRGDFSDARNQFETLARQEPGSPLAEAALFLAGQAAGRSMHPDEALELFDEAAKFNGPLKLYARQEQAITKSGLGKGEDAVALYDDILGSQPEPELRFSALCGKGGDLFAMGAGDPKFYTEAIGVFDMLAAQPDVTAYWRNRALYMKGKCLEQLKKPQEAATVFYDVLQAPNDGAAPDFFWYYKAGFDAGRLMEEQAEWKSAIGIYQKMAGLKGPRAEEAGNRAEQLRLEHFIWEGQ